MKKLFRWFKKDGTNKPGNSGYAPSSSTLATSTTGISRPTTPSNPPAAPKSQTRPEHPKAAAPSLWDRAYDALRHDNPQLVDDYEKLLSRELLGTVANSDASNHGHDHVDESVEKIDNRIDNANPESRRRQLKTIIDRGLQRMEETKTTYTIAGRQFVLQDQIAKAADFALWTRDFVAEAVNVSPEASLAWTGVCLVLPILTNPRAAEQANSDGFAYVTSRLRYYAELEHLLWPANLRSAHDLKKEFEGHIIDLYQHVLEFQLESVLRFYQTTWSGALGHDISGGDKWQTMRSEVEKLQGIVNDEAKAINTLASRQALESFSGNADASLREMQTLLFGDFLLGQDGTGTAGFQVDPESTHAMLASKCIAYMNKELRQDICRIQEPGMLIDEIDKQTIDKHISADLKDACLHWVYHLQLDRQQTIDRDYIYQFIRTHLLHWLEVLALLNKLSEGATAIRELLKISQTWPDIPPQLTRLLRDAEKLVLSFESIIRRAPLQVYGTALAFCPTTSEMKKMYWAQRLQFLESVRGTDLNWNLLFQTLDGHNDSVRELAFSPNGSMVASASHDHTVRLWDTATGDHKQTLEGHSDWVVAVAFSPDGSILASASHDKTVRLWNTATGAHKLTLTGHKKRVTAIAFSPDGSVVASASHDKTARLWDAATGALKQTLRGHNNKRVTVITFSPDGSVVASASYDKTVRLWDVDTGDHKQTLEGHKNWVVAVAFSPDGSVMASASYDHTVRLWDTATGDYKQTLEGHSDWVVAVAFSPDGTMLASASHDKTVRLWDVAAGGHKHTLTGHQSYIGSVAFSPDGSMLASASDDETVQLWDLATGGHKQTLEGHKGYVVVVAFSPDGSVVASASYDKTVRLWDVATGGHKQIPKGHHNCISASAFSLDRNLVASTSDDKTIQLWDVATGCHKQTLTGHQSYVVSVAFSPDGSVVASASYDKTVRLWDAATGRQKQTLTGHKKWVAAVAFSPDNSTSIVASASSDKTVRLWDAVTGRHKQTLTGHNDGVIAVAFSPDGSILASASHDKTVRLWDVATGGHKQTLAGHQSYVISVAFSPDGSMVASASHDKTVRLWDVNTGDHKQTLEGHNERVTAMAFSPDGSIVASASYDETVKIWDAATGAYVQTLDVGRSLTHLSFDPTTELHLSTDIGLLNLRLPSQTPVIDAQSTEETLLQRISHSGYGISTDGVWIVKDGKNILWLPSEYRPEHSAVVGSTVVIGCHSGRILVMKFC